MILASRCVPGKGIVSRMIGMAVNVVVPTLYAVRCLALIRAGSCEYVSVASCFGCSALIKAPDVVADAVILNAVTPKT